MEEEMNDLVDLAKVLVSPCEKLMTIVSGAIGTVYEPRHIRKIADARAYEISTVGQAMREVADIKTTYENGEVSLFTEDFQRLMERTQTRMALQEITKQYNVECVADKAYELLEHENHVTDEPVDKDWINRFFNLAGDISNSEMQDVWARILSGEIKQPGSFSMRTLETIRNISSEEAQAFQSIIPLVIHSAGDYFILSDNELLKKYDSSYPDVMLMDECGFMDSSGTLSINISVSKELPTYLLFDKYVIVLNGKKEEAEKVSLGVHTLTRAGREIFNILIHETSETYVRDVCKYIFEKNKSKVEVAVHNLVNLKVVDDGKEFQYDQTPIISYE